MSFHSALSAVQESSEFKEFKKKSKDSFLFSAFFILNSEFEVETQQVDYYIPKTNSIMTFFVSEGKINSKKDELQNKKTKAKELDTDVKDIDFIISKIKKELTSKPTKVILILQHHEDKQIWNATCMLESFGIINLHYDSKTGKQLMKKDENLFDFMKVEKGKKGEKK